MAATLDGNDLSKVHQISHRKSGNVMVIPIPTRDSDEAEVIDLGGNTELITITGIFDSTSIAGTKAKSDALLALMNANQAAIELITDQTGTLNVRVRSVDITWDISNTPTSVIAGYSITVVRTRT